jgi:glycosyl transferase family 7 (putative galactosyltransferase)
MTSNNPALSVIIPWCDRPEIDTTLRHNHPAFAAYDIEVVIVNCGGQVEPLRTVLGGQSLPAVRWVELPAVHFNKSLALNIGAFAARAERLFFLDTDILLQNDFLPEALQFLDRSSFVTIDRVYESRMRPRSDVHPYLREIAYSIELVDHRGRSVRVETNRVRLPDGSRSGPGLVLLARTHFLYVDGMNAELKGWGWEDLDLLARLQLSLGLRQRRVGAVTHLTHDSALRTVDGSTDTGTEQTNLATCLANYSLGHYGGTYRQDIATWRERLSLHKPIVSAGG